MQDRRQSSRQILSTTHGAVTVKMDEPIRDVLHQDIVELYDRHTQELLPTHDVILKTRWFVQAWGSVLVGQCVMWDQR